MKRWSSAVVLGLFVASSAMAQFQGYVQGRAGLIDWYERLTTYVEQPIASWSEMKRMNIVLIGDSHMEGVIDKAAGDTLADNYGWRNSNLFRRDLRASVYGSMQNASTGAPLLGGIDFVPSVNSATTPLIAAPTAYTGGEIFGTWTDHRFNDATPAQGVCMKYTQTSQPGAYKRFYRLPSGFSDPNRSFGGVPTGYQFVYQQIPGGGQMEVALTNYGGNTVYASFVVDCASPDEKEHYGLLSPVLPVNISGSFWVRIKNVSATAAPIRWEGCNVFSGDENFGIHVTNYACGGTFAESFANDANVEGIARANPDVIGIWLGHNDIFTRKYTPAQFVDQMEILIKKIQARMPKVSVWIEHAFYYKPEFFLLWDEAHVRLEQLASKYRVALLSHHLHAGGQSAEQWLVPKGYKEPFKGHLTRTGQQYLADARRQLLDRRVAVAGGG